MDRDVILPSNPGSPFLHAVPRRPALTWRNAYDNITAYQPNDAVEYQGSSYICILATTGNLPTNSTYWSLLAAKGETGDTGSDGADGEPGTPGADGAQGPFGGAISFEFTFSTTTTEADPGDGVIRLNQSTQNIATEMYVDLLDANGVTITNALDTLNTGGAFGEVRFDIRLVAKSDPTKYLLFGGIEVISQTGYREVLLDSLLASSSSSPFTNGQAIIFHATIVGKKGDTGANGSDGAPGADGSDATAADIKIFTASGTWTKPLGAVSVTVHLIGAGGSGGSGRIGASGNVRGAGGGGGGGGYSVDTFSAGALTGTVSVTVGAGGAPPAGNFGTNANGASGSAGGATSFGAYLSAGGGGAGGGGTTSAGTTGAAGTGTTANGTAGGTGGVGGSTIAVGADASNNSNHMAGGGGGGGAGANSSNVEDTFAGLGGNSGGIKGNRGASSNIAGNGILTVRAEPGGNGPAFIAGTTLAEFGGAGAGGGPTNTGSTSGIAQTEGRVGGLYGGGGGGGAAKLNSQPNFNQGGEGGPGICVVITTF